MTVKEKAKNQWPVGLKVRKVRHMTNAELGNEGWGDDRTVMVIEFCDGSIIFASRDDEGNGSGTLFGRDKAGEGFYVC